MWNLQDNFASLQHAGWQVGLQLDAPLQGLTVTTPTGSSVSRLFGVDFPRPHQPFAAECFVRQGDLIVPYPQREGRNFSLQLDYRLLEANATMLLMEFWVSVQTYLLDSHPAVEIGLHPAADAAEGEIGIASTPEAMTFSSIKASDSVVNESHPNGWALLSSLMESSKPLSVAWFLHPRDQFDSSWRYEPQDGRWRVRLFGHFMEKGVIRRARLRCLCQTVPIDRSTLARSYQDLTTSPLPLTA